MREHHTFWIAGCAGGVDQGQKVVFFNLFAKRIKRLLAFIQFFFAFFQQIRIREDPIFIRLAVFNANGEFKFRQVRFDLFQFCQLNSV